MKKLVIVAAILLAAAPAHADTIAIVGATVWQTPTKKLEGATVVIRDGKITAVGKGAAVPSGATTIDGTGKIVTAGLIEAYSDLGLVSVDLEAAGNDGRLGDTVSDDDQVHASYRVIDGYDADAVSIPVARTGGVTSVVSVPRGGLVAGQSAWFALADGVTADDAVRGSAAMHVALGGGAAGASGNSRGRAIEMLRDLLDDAAAFAKNKGAYDRNQSRKLSAARGDLEALGAVLRGDQPLVINADSEHDIRAALRLARGRKIRIVIVGGTEAWKVAKELAKAKVAVILDPQANNPDLLDAPDVRDDSAAVLTAAGVAVAISTVGDGTFARTIRQRAGDAVGDGLAWADALAALTTVPAAIYGVKDRGTVEKGSVADVVVWTGDPLEIATRAETVIIGGVVQSLETHQTELLKKYR
jgi:imidazolonepropionase-like amidohydrolase